MPANLRDIRKFPDLIRYLEAELEWPVEAGSFDDLTFEYVPAELGLKDEDAVAIKKIHQLRPLASGQPWGVFLVEFEKKKLPVVVLRRILSHLVIKKRASANKSDRAAWNPNDLLFISAFGEEASDAREIAFAHFHQQDGDLPTLQVLGWDGGDTVLKLEHVAGELREKLHWPQNPKDHAAWRTQWSRAFRHKLGHTVRTADDLAEVLAALARSIRERCSALMRAESDRGPLTKLFQAFQAALIHDLTPESFADTYAQTITYGLFTAAVNRTDLSGGTEATFVKADDMTLMARSTSPFLKEMLETFLHVGGRKNGVDFDELGIQDVVELLRGDETDLPAILRDFGNRTRGEDPVIHFYEHFLSAYNKKLKIQRGVFYTPQPVVSYIVRSVHELLQTEFGLEDGLASTVTWGEMIQRSERSAAVSPRPAAAGTNAKDALEKSDPPVAGEAAAAGLRHSRAPLKLPPLSDEPGDTRTISPDEPFVQILDPATGTATFLVEVIDVIFKTLKAKWDKGGLSAMPSVSLAPIGGEGRGEGVRLALDAGEKRQRTAALHDASRPSSAPGQRASVLDCASPLALSDANAPIVNRKSPIVNFLDYWNAYVPQHLLPRLHGYELLAAPYAIAHLKLGLKLTETGYRFGSAERARIYLTNALEPKVRQLPQIGFEPLAHEAQAVNEIKWYKRFTVVIGNPPYSGVSSNNSEHAVRLVDAYKKIDGERLNEKKLWLQDDYVKFIRIGQQTIEKTLCGILGYITNHGYLDNPTFRGMRQSLLASFGLRTVLDLHGNAKKKEVAPDGTADENVFDIQQGVAVGLFVKGGGKSELSGCVYRGDLFGSRESKYSSLITASLRTLVKEVLNPTSPFYLFVKQDQTHRSEFEAATLLSEVTLQHSVGVVTARDHLTIAFSRDEIWERAREFARLPEREARETFELRNDVRDWKVALAQADLRAKPLNREFIKPILYRPFDVRYTYYTGRNKGFIGQPAAAIMAHMIDRKNVGLMTTRKVEIGTFGHAICANLMTESHSVSLKEVNYLFPLWLHPDGDDLAFSVQKQPNFTPAFLKALASRLQLSQTKPHGLPDGVTPEDIFHYAYAVFHSPGYRRRYAEFLKIDFPRLPLTGKLELFRALARLGGELTALHLLEFEVGRVTPCAPGQKPSYAELTEYLGGRAPAVEKVSFTRGAAVPAASSRGVPPRVASGGGTPPAPAGEDACATGTVWLDKAQTTGFAGVREDVWNFHIGGYQVCEKWLKDRKGRTLSAADREHYQKIVVALSETIRLMQEIDAVIEKHGGWPLK